MSSLIVMDRMSVRVAIEYKRSDQVNDSASGSWSGAESWASERVASSCEGAAK
jgi:hypothetical protein